MHLKVFLTLYQFYIEATFKVLMKNLDCMLQHQVYSSYLYSSMLFLVQYQIHIKAIGFYLPMNFDMLLGPVYFFLLLALSQVFLEQEVL